MPFSFAKLKVEFSDILFPNSSPLTIPMVLKPKAFPAEATAAI